MEQKKYKQINTKTPEIQEMILSYQIGGVAYELSQRLEISPALALDLFYRSKTCAQLHDKRTDADFRQAVRQLDLSHSSQPVEGVRTNRRDAFLDHDFRNAVDIALPRTIQHTICLFTGSIAVMGFRSAVHPIVR